MQIVSMIFLIIFFAAFAGVIKPYIGNLTRWQFAVAAFVSAMICGATSPTPNEASRLTSGAESEAAEQEPQTNSSEEIVSAKRPEKPEPAARPTETAKEEGAKSKGASAPKRSTQHNIVIMSRDGVRARLKDPDSADFRNVGYYSGGSEGAAVCGEVNAKNGFGGFGGFERFVAMGPKVAFLESDVEASEFAIAWKGLCVKADTDEVNIP
ncbi:hypothetical protein GCM10023115_00450 [Pontixanthobacter gangjinensis]|uniref:Uncharacterized protein n=1 Tax=Pontixanthobacter gangjinensis TaxID=1028742 RepID=A0A6I4SI42_9SPHN|nr:hypothetical protein [Pontixanthobacter gangjinensis]MXO55299.1 hypothetical protein [Pontixanthobacter gangjinensis]